MSVEKTLSIPGLANGTQYNVKIRAVRSDALTLTSGTVTATPATLPEPPSIIQVAGIDGGLQIFFSAPQYNGGLAVTNYKYSIDGGQTYVTPSPATTASPITVKNLTNGTNYAVLLKSINAVGESIASESLVGAPSRVPDTPGITRINATSSSTAQIFFTMTQPSLVAPVKYYEYSLNNGGSYTALANDSLTSPLTITGLTNGSTYDIRLRAVNSAGAGPASPSTKLLVGLAPGKPTITAVTRGDRQLSLAITAPGSSDRAPVINYEYSLDNGATWSARFPSSNASPLVVSGLTNGNTYSVSVRGISLSGAGEASDPTSPVKVFAAPAQPVITDVRGTNNSIRVKFTVEDNGSPITNILYATSTTTTPTTYTTFSPATGDVRQITIPNLANANTYNIRIKAINAVGPSPESLTFTAASPRGVPDAPANYTISTTAKKFNVTLTLPSNNGYPITDIGYFLYFPNTTSTAAVTSLDSTPFKTLLYGDPQGSGYDNTYEGFTDQPIFRKPNAFFRRLRGVAYSSLNKKLYFSDTIAATLISSGANLSLKQLNQVFGVPEQYDSDSTVTSSTKLAFVKSLTADAQGNIYMLDAEAYYGGFFVEPSYGYRILKKIDANGNLTNILTQPSQDNSNLFLGRDGDPANFVSGLPGYPAGVYPNKNLAAIAYGNDGYLYWIDPSVAEDSPAYGTVDFFLGPIKSEPSIDPIRGATIRRINLQTKYIDTVVGYFTNKAGYKDGIDRNTGPYTSTAYEAYAETDDPEYYRNTLGQGRRVRFRNPKGLAIDNAGNLYVADTYNHVIRKVVPLSRVYAGLCTASMSGSVMTVTDVSAGTPALRVGTVIYYAAAGNISANTTITALGTGSGGIGTYILSNPHTIASTQIYFGSPTVTLAFGNISGTSMTLTSVVKGDFFYDSIILPVGDVVANKINSSSNDNNVLDGNYTLPTYTLASSQASAISNKPIFIASTITTTIAGSAGLAGIADGIGSDARFNYPTNVCVDNATGNLYIADTGNHTIRQITPAGLVTTLAGTIGTAGYLDGVGTNAQLYYPHYVSYAEGHVYFLHEDYAFPGASTHIVRKLNVLTGVVETVIGTPYYDGGLITGTEETLSKRYNLGLRLSSTTAEFEVASFFPSINYNPPSIPGFIPALPPSGTSFALKMVAYNSAGTGDISLGRGIVLIGAPSQIATGAATRIADNINFSVTFDDTGGSDILSMRLDVYSNSAKTNLYQTYNFSVADTTLTYDANTKTATFTISVDAYLPGTYYYSFYATNSSGESDDLYFVSSEGMQSIQIRRAPTGIAITSITPQPYNKLNIAYSLTSTGGEATLAYSLNSADYVIANYSPTTTGNFNIENLTSGEGYTVKLKLYNDIGFVETNTSSEVELITKPKPPTLTLVAAASKEITVDVSTDPETGGKPLTTYSLNVLNTSTSTNTTITLPLNTQRYTVSGLTNGITYTLKLSVSNSEPLTSDWTATVSAMPVGLPLNFPTITAIDEYDLANPLGGTVTVSFTFAEQDLNGSTFAGVEYSLDSGVTWNRKYTNQIYVSPNALGRAFGIFSLEIGREYALILRTVNQVGSGTTYTQPVKFTPGRYPKAATLTYGDFVFGGNQQIPVFLTQPQDKGGHPITEYRLFRPDNTGKYDLQGTYETYAPTSPLVIESTLQHPLVNDEYYNFNIQTVNKFGGGDFVYVLSRTQTGVSTPGAPTISKISSGNLGRLLVYFTPGTSGSAPTLFYQYKAIGYGSSGLWTSADVTTASFIGTISNAQGTGAGNILKITEITGDNAGVLENDLIDSVSGAYIVSYVSPLGGTEISFAGAASNSFLNVTGLALGSNNIELDMAIDKKLASATSVLPGTIITGFEAKTCVGKIDNGTAGSAGTVLTVTSGAVVPNSLISGTGIAANTTVGTEFQTETFLASARAGTLTVPSTVTRRFRVGEYITGAGIPENTYIASDSFTGEILGQDLTVYEMPFLVYGDNILQVGKYVGGTNVLEDTKIVGYASSNILTKIEAPSFGIGNGIRAVLKIQKAEPLIIYPDQVITGPGIPATSAVFKEKYTASISGGFILTVTEVLGFLEPGVYLAGDNVPAGARIVKFLNGTLGGIGQYEVAYSDPTITTSFSLSSRVMTMRYVENPTTLYLYTTGSGTITPTAENVQLSTAIGGSGKYSVDKSHTTLTQTTYTTGGVAATRYKLSSNNFSTIEQTVTTAPGGPGVYAVNISQLVASTTISTAAGKAGKYTLNKPQNIAAQTFKSTSGGVGVYNIDKNLSKTGSFSVSRPITVTGLVPDYSYTVSLRAVSRYGTSGESNIVTATARAGVSAPVLLQDSITSTAVILNIVVPAVPPTNRPLLLDYVYSTDGGNSYRAVDEITSTQLKLYRVPRGQTTNILVAGRNIDGVGNWSEVITVTTAATAPSIPADLSYEPTLDINGDNVPDSVDIVFTPALDNGSAILNYEAAMEAAWTNSPVYSTVVVTDHATLPDKKKFTKTGSYAGAPYTVYIRAVNAVGTGPVLYGPVVPAFKPSQPAFDVFSAPPPGAQYVQGAFWDYDRVYESRPRIEFLTPYSVSEKGGAEITNYQIQISGYGNSGAWTNLEIRPAAERGGRYVYALIPTTLFADVTPGGTVNYNYPYDVNFRVVNAQNYVSDATSTKTLTLYPTPAEISGQFINMGNGAFALEQIAIPGGLDLQLPTSDYTQHALYGPHKTEGNARYAIEQALNQGVPIDNTWVFNIAGREYKFQTTPYLYSYASGRKATEYIQLSSWLYLISDKTGETQQVTLTNPRTFKAYKLYGGSQSYIDPKENNLPYSIVGFNNDGVIPPPAEAYTTGSEQKVDYNINFLPTYLTYKDNFNLKGYEYSVSNPVGDSWKTTQIYVDSSRWSTAVGTSKHRMLDINNRTIGINFDSAGLGVFAIYAPEAQAIVPLQAPADTDASLQDILSLGLPRIFFSFTDKTTPPGDCAEGFCYPGQNQYSFGMSKRAQASSLLRVHRVLFGVLYTSVETLLKTWLREWRNYGAPHDIGFGKRTYTPAGSEWTGTEWLKPVTYPDDVLGRNLILGMLTNQLSLAGAEVTRPNLAAYINPIELGSNWTEKSAKIRVVSRNPGVNALFKNTVDLVAEDKAILVGGEGYLVNLVNKPMVPQVVYMGYPDVIADGFGGLKLTGDLTCAWEKVNNVKKLKINIPYTIPMPDVGPVVTEIELLRRKVGDTQEPTTWMKINVSSSSTEHKYNEDIFNYTPGGIVSTYAPDLAPSKNTKGTTDYEIFIRRKNSVGWSALSYTSHLFPITIVTTKNEDYIDVPGNYTEADHKVVEYTNILHILKVPNTA